MITLTIEFKYDPAMLNGSLSLVHKVLKKVILHVKKIKINGLKISINTVRQSKVDSPMQYPPLVIAKKVCNYFNCNLQYLFKDIQISKVVEVRQITQYFCRKLNKNKVSWADIALIIGGQDHSSAIHAFKNISNFIETDKKFRIKIDEIEKRLKQ
jgi:chromosomal replication initiator protein